MKGQGFTLAYVIIGISLILLLFNFQARILKARENINEISNLYNKITDNIIKESFFILRINGAINDFLNITKMEYDVSSLILIANYKKNENYLNITIINFLDEDYIFDIWLNDTNKIVVVNKNSINSTNFSVTNGTYILNFTYKLNNQKTIEISTNLNYVYSFIETDYIRNEINIVKVKEDEFYFR
ncbi:MAG: hypothetical protein QW641_02340 [Candidatus Aenigmatarchaeota archaeon]